MGEGIAHIISPLSAPWCGWTMLALMACAVLAELSQPGIITQAPASLFSRTDRNYKDSPVTFFGQLFIACFRVGTLAMALCTCLYDGVHCSLTQFGALSGVVLAVLLVKMVCNLVLDYTFSFSRKVASPYEHYGNIATIATCVLFVAVMAVMRFGDVEAAMWVFWSVATLFVLMWLYRICRLFAGSLKAVIYVLIYTVTLEALPLACLYYLSEKTILLI